MATLCRLIADFYFKKVCNTVRYSLEKNLVPQIKILVGRPLVPATSLQFFSGGRGSSCTHPLPRPAWLRPCPPSPCPAPSSTGSTPSSIDPTCRDHPLQYQVRIQPISQFHAVFQCRCTALIGKVYRTIFQSKRRRLVFKAGVFMNIKNFFKNIFDYIFAYIYVCNKI